MKKLPINKTILREIVDGNCCYVDKTYYIKQMLDDDFKYWFLARPRRFGKSLFLDTLRAAFAGEKELFNGLFLEKNWNWNVKYPVIKISFGKGIFIFEIKMKSNPKDAIEQIKEKKYQEKYLSENKKLFLIGIEFNEDEKNISKFDVEKI